MPPSLRQRTLDGGSPKPNTEKSGHKHTRKGPGWRKPKSKAAKKGAERTPTKGKIKPKRAISKDIRKAATQYDMARAPKRSALDPPDSSGKAGDPHRLERGALVRRSTRISEGHRLSLDWRLVGAAAEPPEELD